MTALAEMTPVQKIVAGIRQAGLDDPTQYGMIARAWNQATRTYIYCHDNWQLYYHYHNSNCGYWIARNLEMGLSLEFDRDETIPVMMATMAQAETDVSEV